MAVYWHIYIKRARSERGAHFAKMKCLNWPNFLRIASIAQVIFHVNYFGGAAATTAARKLKIVIFRKSGDNDGVQYLRVRLIKCNWACAQDFRIFIYTAWLMGTISKLVHWPRTRHTSLCVCISISALSQWTVKIE